MGGWSNSRFFRRGGRSAVVQRKRDVLFSVTALACGSVGALFGLFVGYAVLGFPICISTTIVGGVFGASLGRYLG
jgi:hypothetical protein